MRAGWAILAGLLLGGGAAWWLAREPDGQRQQREARAQQAARATAADAVPSLYRWRDDAGVLQVTDKPPKGRRYQRVARDTAHAIQAEGPSQ